MTLNRYAKRRDHNEGPIVKELRQCGLQVRQQDFPDLIIRRPSDGRLQLVEIDGVTRNRKRNPKQLKFLADWQIPRIKSTEEVLNLFGL